MSDFDLPGQYPPDPSERVTLSIDLVFNINRLIALDPDFTAFLQEQLDQLLVILVGRGAELGSQITVSEVLPPNIGIDLTLPQFQGLRRTIS